MTALFHAHSGLRYLVLLAGAVALAWFLYGWARGKPFAPPAPAILTALIGLIDLQIVLGFVLYIGGRTAPWILLHLGLMLAAAGVLHFTSIMRRRRAPAGYALPLAGTVLAIVLMIGGILALGREVI